MTMGTDIQTFFLERWDGRSTSASDNSWEITLAELLNFGDLQNYGMSSSYTIPMAIKHNLRANGFGGIATILGTQVAAKMLGKAGLYRNFNKIVRQAGLGNLVKA